MSSGTVIGFCPCPAQARGRKCAICSSGPAGKLKVFRAAAGTAGRVSMPGLPQTLPKRKDRPLSRGRNIFLSIWIVIWKNAPDAVLFSAFNENGKLAGCAIGDYSALNTAFYMLFAFRAEYAPPGVADLLLEAVIAEAGARAWPCQSGAGY